MHDRPHACPLTDGLLELSTSSTRWLRSRMPVPGGPLNVRSHSTERLGALDPLVTFSMRLLTVGHHRPVECPFASFVHFDMSTALRRRDQRVLAVS